MKLDRYISSLLPSFSKTRMMEDLNIMREELKTTTIPPYKSVVAAYGKRKFASVDIQAFEKQFENSVNTKFRGNFLSIILQTLERMDDNMETMEKLVNAYYADDVMRDAMTFLKVNLIQYMETMSFTMRYSRRLLVWIVSAEITAVDKESNEAPAMSPAELEWLNAHRQNFFAGLTIMSGEKAELEKRFKEVPDIVATKENIPMIEKTVGVLKTDPFNFGLIPVFLNPIYHVRMAIAEWQVNRYKAAQEEKKMLEFKLMHLKDLDAGKKNPKLQEQIEYTEQRLAKLNYKLAQQEESYG